MGRLLRKFLIPAVLFSSLLAENNAGNLKERDFEEAYNHLKSNWDGFQEQVSLARSIVFSNELEDMAGTFCPGQIIFRQFNKWIFIHELAHIQYCNTNIKNLEKKWNEITRSYYLGDKYQQAGIENLMAIGGISYYSLFDVREDIAETARFVYLLNDPSYYVYGFSNKHEDSVSKRNDNTSYVNIDAQMIFSDREKARPFASKLIKKIGLLEEYGFVSRREARHTVGEIFELLKK